MKKILLIINSMILLSLFSCKVQLYTIKTTSPMSIEDSSYVFENDTVKITYSFWGERGVLSYRVYNKTNRPIYIDWKKSSFIYNNQTFSYRVDKRNIDGLNYYQTSLENNLTDSRHLLSSDQVRQEEMTEIAPKSFIYSHKFVLMPKSDASIPKTANSVDYTPDNSPLVFRNFIVLSASDNFNRESYIDNGFYLSHVSQKSKKDFYSPVTLDYNKVIAYYPDQTPTGFYTYPKWIKHVTN